MLQVKLNSLFNLFIFKLVGCIEADVFILLIREINIQIMISDIQNLNTWSKTSVY